MENNVVEIEEFCLSFTEHVSAARREMVKRSRSRVKAQKEIILSI